MDNRQQESKRFAVHSDDIRESFKLAFDSVKHLTTISAATLAVFATFLDRIFPPDLDDEVKILVGLSFASFIVSLVTSAFSLQRIAGLMRSRRQYSRKKQKVRWNILVPSLAYILGLSLFGTAVLLDVFYEAESLRGEGGRFVVYGALLLLICGAIGWARYRVRRGNLRDKEGEYEVMYPGVRDYDELVAREKPGEAFTRLNEQMYDGGSPEGEREVQQQQGSLKDQPSGSDIRQQAYADLLSVTHPHKLVVIGKQIPINFLEFRDTVNKLEAQVTLLSPPEVRRKAIEMVDSFVDCVTAKENQLREERKEEDERGEPNLLERLGLWLSRPSLKTKGQGKERKDADDLEKEMKKRMKKILEKEFDKNLADLSKARDEFVYVTRKDLAGTT